LPLVVYKLIKQIQTFKKKHMKSTLYIALIAASISFLSCKKEEKKPANEMTFTDSRDGKVYPLVKIGEQIWFAKSIQYNQGGKPCYNGDCDRYGRYYDYTNAISVCPAGYRCPSDADWVELEQYAGMAINESYVNGFYRGVAEQIGTKLGVGGALGFNLEMSDGGGLGFYYTSSTDSTDVNYAYIRGIRPGSSAGISRSDLAKTSPFCVRCLKN
jgi:uncharacterized protein (TIGR02145 family)